MLQIPRVLLTVRSIFCSQSIPAKLPWDKTVGVDADVPCLKGKLHLSDLWHLAAEGAPLVGVWEELTS